MGRSMAAISIGATARDVLVGCHSRGNRKKYLAVLTAITDYILGFGEPKPSAGIDEDLWAALKGEADRMNSAAEAHRKAGAAGGRPPKQTNQNQTEPNETKINQTKPPENQNEPREEERRGDKSREPPTPTGGDGPDPYLAEALELEEMSARLWESYPPLRRGSLSTCRRSLACLRRGGELPPWEVLATRLEADKRSEAWLDQAGRFVPTLTRWLEQRPWLAAEPGQKKEAASPRPMRAASLDDEADLEERFG